MSRTMLLSRLLLLAAVSFASTTAAAQGACNVQWPSAITQRAIEVATRSAQALRWDVQLKVDGQGKVTQATAKSSAPPGDELVTAIEQAARRFTCQTDGSMVEANLQLSAQPQVGSGTPIAVQASWFTPDTVQSFPRLAATEFVLAPVFPSTQYRVNPKPCPLNFKLVLRSSEANEVWNLPVLRAEASISAFRVWAQQLRKNPALPDSLMRLDQPYDVTLACKVVNGVVVLD